MRVPGSGVLMVSNSCFSFHLLQSLPNLMKQDNYYSYIREDIIEIASGTGSIDSVLDVGCGYGYTGLRLKEIGAQKVEGIELSANAYIKATDSLDKVYHGSCEDEGLLEKIGLYDCILCADILEHLKDPWLTIRILKRHINKGGRLIGSIPNIRYYKVLSNLLFFGAWNYENSGILDRTHLRFFTRKSIISMFVQNGYKVKIQPQKIRPIFFVFNFLTFNILRDFFPMKYYFIAYPPK